MNDSNTLIEIYKIITPSVFALILLFVTNFLNNFSKEKEESKNQLKQSMDNLYFPFFKNIYIASGINGLSVIEYDNDSLSAINGVLIYNIFYAKTTTQTKILDYYLHSQMLIRYRANGDTDFRDYDKVLFCFDVMYNELFKEYTHICNKLKLPKPISIFSD